MSQNTTGHVFMSYSRRDESVMRRVVSFLRKRGINVWVDNERLVPGTPIWEVEIEKAIKGASAIIVILSPDSKNSEWVRREISLADQHHKRIFPVLVLGDEDSSITIRLITRQYVDIRQNEEIGLGSLSIELIRYLKEIEAQEQRAREEAESLARKKAAKDKAERKAAEAKAKRETEKQAAGEQTKHEGFLDVYREKTDNVKQEKHGRVSKESKRFRFFPIQRYILRRVIIGAIGVFVITVGAWGISHLSSLGTATELPEITEPAQVTAEATKPAAEEPAAEKPMIEEVTITMGFTSSLTGSQGVSSKRQVNGFNLWMDQVNEAGGVTLSNGTVVKFAAQTYDDESNAERVQELYTRLITEDNADFLISPYSSGLTSAASIVAEQNGKVMITTGADDDDAYKTGNTSLFQLYTPGSLYMSSTVDMLKVLDPEATVALVYEAAKFSTDVAEGIKPYLETNGFEVVLEESYATDTADFGPIVNKIAASGATVLLGGGHYNDGTALARALYDRNVGLKFAYLLVAPADSKFPEMGDAALGIAVSSQWELIAAHTEAEASNMGMDWFGPNGEEFSAAYEAAYGDPPTYHAAGGYAAGLVLQKAIIDADSVDSEAVKVALNAMNLMTFFGGTKFDTSEEAHGLQIAHKMVVAQWQKNDAGELERVIIAPADVATAIPLYPIP